MTDYESRFQQAEALRKARDFNQAVVILRDLWEEHADVRSGSRLIYCYRKAGEFAAGIKTAKVVLARFPRDEWSCRELGWCLYYQELKPAQERGDLGRVVHAAGEILKVTNDELVSKQAVFSVIRVAKYRGKWDLVLQWCDRLDLVRLSSAPNTIGDKESMSDREQWYYAKLKGLVESEQWQPASAIAALATDDFPRNPDFKRWGAVARANSGDLARGLAELESLARMPNTQWFVLNDLADIYARADDMSSALRVGCKAALAYGDVKAKVNLFVLLARIGLATGDIEFAQAHIALAKAVRQREGWSVPSELIEIERRMLTDHDNTNAIATMSLQQLVALCRKQWQAHVTTGQQRFVGSIKSLPDGKPFAFIAPEAGGQDIFVVLRDLPPAARSIGTRVEYGVEASFDAKKNKEGLRAIDVVMSHA